MKTKRMFGPIAALLGIIGIGIGGLVWQGEKIEDHRSLTRPDFKSGPDPLAGSSSFDSPAPASSATETEDVQTGPSNPATLSKPNHHPPDPIRKFRKLTPEERVKLARQGAIGG